MAKETYLLVNLETLCVAGGLTVNEGDELPETAAGVAQDAAAAEGHHPTATIWTYAIPAAEAARIRDENDTEALKTWI